MRCWLFAALIACSASEKATRENVNRIDASIDASVDAEPTIDASLDATFLTLAKDAPCIRYGRLDRDACEGELKKRGIAFARAEPLAKVRAPVRLRGPLSGVAFHSSLPEKMREKSTNDVIDCRLVLALDDFAKIVAKSDVTVVVFASAYRSPGANGCTAKYSGKQHCGALAADVFSFAHKDGTELTVAKDFHGAELSSFVRSAGDQHLFNVILTPNYNDEHKDHVHLEITPDVDWMLIH